jgi:hypothetical protein
MLLNNLYQTESQHWQPFYSWKMAPPHTCMRWKVENIYDWYKEHKQYISNKTKKVKLTNMLVSFVFFPSRF